MSTSTIAVIGSGSIGTSWAIVFAGAGRAVRVHDIARDRLKAAEQVLVDRLEELAGFGLLGEPSDVIAGRISFTTDLAAAVHGAVHVQECIPEDREAKLEVFAAIADLASHDCVIASSSSFIPISQTASTLPGRERFLVIHPGNPPFLLRIAEICPAPFTDPVAIDRSEALLRSCGLSPVRVRIEKDGFVFNRLQGALLREAYSLIAEGVTTAADIDLLVREGLGFRWSVVGPFEAIDLNTRGGIAAHARRMLPAYVRMGAERGERQGWTDETIDAVVAERRAALPLDQWDERVSWRDGELMALLAFRRRRP
jgi:3-hydroxyacyl-CoA dehydrogenase